jgi:hypothetical protein
MCRCILSPPVNRRSVLKTLGAFLLARTGVARLFARGATPTTSGAASVIAGAQANASPAAFTATEVSTLGAIAEVVLPSTLTADDRRIAVRAFTTWFNNYKPGADMGHSYGASTLRQPSGPSPVARYPAQFVALNAAARDQGAATFAALALPLRRQLVEAALNTTPPVSRMPAQPSGANLIADFMGSWFNSQDGWNACYQAEINRDTCRTLDGSERAPKPIAGIRT